MNKVKWLKNKQLLAAFFFLGLFVFLRIWRIDRSLFFYGDMGRDLSVLIDWQKSGKPPLLGPQASAVAFTHSPFYFYTLFPVYLLSKGSEYTAIITNIGLGLTLMGLSLWLARKEKQLYWTVLVYIGLLAVFPQHVLQSRYVWNPTFVPYWLLLALIGWHQLLLKGYSRKSVILFALGGGGALAFSYSVLPTLGLLFLSLLVKLRVTLLRVMAWFMTCVGFFFFPMVVFDLRHKFFLLNQLFFGHRAPQPNLTISDQFHLFSDFIFEGNLYLGIIFTLSLLWAILLFKSKSKVSPNLVVGLILLTNSLVLIIGDIHIAAHYIFGVVAIFFWWVAHLPAKWKLMTVPILLVGWFLSDTLTKAFEQAPRNFIEIMTCAQLVCSAEQEPLFITAQTGYYPQHDAPEFKYVFKKAGCLVKELDKEPNSAHAMAVVVDNSTYEHAKTSFNELTQFGKSSEVRVYACNPKLQVYMLDKAVQ